MSIKDTIKRLLGVGFSVDEAIQLVAGAGDVTEAQPQPEPVRTFADRKVNPFLVETETREHTGDRYAPVFPDAPVSEPVKVTRRRKRNYRPRVGYQLTTLARNLAQGKGTAKQREAFKNLYPVAADCLKAISKSKAPLSNRDVERATEHGRKSVESSIYQLRHFGLIESVPLNQDSE